MTEMLSWTPLDAARWAAPFDLYNKSPFTMLDSIQRLFDGDSEKTAIRLEESVQDHTLVIRAELPGIDPEKDVEVTVADGVLTIKAHREDTSQGSTDTSYHSEFRYGSMLRRIALPDGATEADVRATYKDGILEVRTPLPETTTSPSPTKVTITRS